MAIVRKYCLEFGNHMEHIFGRPDKHGDIQRYVCPGYDDR